MSPLSKRRHIVFYCGITNCYSLGLKCPEFCMFLLSMYQHPKQIMEPLIFIIHIKSIKLLPNISLKNWQSMMIGPLQFKWFYSNQKYRGKLSLIILKEPDYNFILFQQNLSVRTWWRRTPTLWYWMGFGAILCMVPWLSADCGDWGPWSYFSEWFVISWIALHLCVMFYFIDKTFIEVMIVVF